MRTEAWIFGVCALFFLVVAPAYWLITQDPTGAAALTMTFLLCLMVTMYLGFHARSMAPRPEDRKGGEILEGAGELGFFPPYSWWPLWCALTLSMMMLGVVFGWWLVIIGSVFGIVALCGWIFEYYRGIHAH